MTRFGILMTGYLALGALILPAIVRPAPQLIWNASASVPIGLYAARPVDGLTVGDLVAAMPPEPLAQLMAGRGYLPLRTPMLKRVAAVTGQRVCRIGKNILIDGSRVAVAQSRDVDGRALPAWQGCRTLGPDAVLLLNRDAPASFDGRYFGPISRRSIHAVLTPLWLVGAPRARAKTRPRSTTKGANHDQDR
ncbi:S26 family signal peptidase [Sphingomonas sp. R647]|uniref:S26 family signal peptidase n=1 Tax=Sphingomonas sp. R647 TaxID=2875233 RepID=UPI001CD27388|nr:S26 family signal peptidase [Sphingomonas sp. R647]MCA1200161.1 S26 family signal peptidase [Sphingomonas sp. R647]